MFAHQHARRRGRNQLSGIVRRGMNILLVATGCFSLGQARTFGTSVETQVDPSGVVFQDDVIASLSKGGCNSGRCHGNASGRGRFKLSLRGQRPAEDMRAILFDAESRRVNRVAPERSLLLLKATAQVPHEGGLRFPIDSPEYEAILNWIGEGLSFQSPPPRQVTRIDVTPKEAVLEAGVGEIGLQVRAVYSDGSSKDVTALSIFDSTDATVSVTDHGVVHRRSSGPATIVVRYLQEQVAVGVAFLPPADVSAYSAPKSANAIDMAVFRRLEELRIRPSRPTTDIEFLRRASIDMTGRLPTASEARAFVEETSEDKRARLIDRLLASPAFADHWARKWADLLRVEEKSLDAKGVAAFYEWIRDAIEQDKPQDAFVRELLTATGSTYDAPATNFYRALRKADLRAEAVAQVFLGTRLQCAKCHDHPFERWTQNDYYDFAALFAPIDYTIVENTRKDGFDKNQFIGEQIVRLDTTRRAKNPDTDSIARGRFLGEPVTSDVPIVDRLQAFAEWLTASNHPTFARVIANRVWAAMMGIGVVDPTDDFRVTNPPSNPELLDVLSQTLVRGDFRLRPFIREIANSQVYQLSTEPNASNQEDRRNFSHAMISRLPAEVLLDAIDQVTEVDTKFEGYALGVRAGQLPGINKVYRRSPPKDGLRFLQMFGKPPRIMTCSCERMTETTLGQVFELTSGAMVHKKLASPQNCLTPLLNDGKTESQIVDELFWRTLSRAPSHAEAEALTEYVAAAKNRRQAYEDILWGLINSKEFLMRR